jgi:uncharacterized protein YmfQ (DUF2313 family)
VDASDFTSMLIKLFPWGKLFNFESGSELFQTATAIAQELARVYQRGQDLIEEFYPNTALETLPDWETMLGIPDACSPTLPDSITARQALITQKFTAMGGQSLQYFIDLATTLGFSGATITEFNVLQAGFSAGDLVNSDAWAYTWQLNLPLGSQTFFVAGSNAGDSLALWESSTAECTIQRTSPGHTIVLFAYT